MKQEESEMQKKRRKTKWWRNKRTDLGKETYDI